MKANSVRNRDFFRAEAEGLSAIRKTKTIRTPDVLAMGTDGGRSSGAADFVGRAEGDRSLGTSDSVSRASSEKDSCSFLLLEYIESGRGSRASSEELGRDLARMHLADAAGMYPVYTKEARKEFVEMSPEDAVECNKDAAGMPPGKTAERNNDPVGVQLANTSEYNNHPMGVPLTNTSEYNNHPMGVQTETAAGYANKSVFGFMNDNYIGASVQINTPKSSWITFFSECRLRPQFEMAAKYFGSGEWRGIDRFLQNLDRYLAEPEKPSLLHGDLWAGNYMIDAAGAPWLIDPAVYVGHAEADLAMTELFGGFDNAFYSAYREIARPDPAYKDRRDLYNLYHLLNHLNLFGGGYLSSVKSILRRYL